MSENLKVQGVSVPQVAVGAAETSAPVKSAAPVVVACDDHVGGATPSIGAERAKLSPLQAPGASGVIRGTSKVADGTDLWAGMMIGGLWVDAVSH